MDRRSFLHTGCLACAAGFIAPALLTSCASGRSIVATLEGEDLTLPVSDFIDTKGRPRPYVIATHEKLAQPIAVFHAEDGGYRALLMRCTHKGVELRVTGDRLECSAHGSVFASTGAVLEGPASSPLRVLPAVERDGRVFISLKA